MVSAGGAILCGLKGMIELPFVRFALVGFANTAVGYGAIMLLHSGFGAEPVPANVGGYLIGAFLSYMLNRNFTFASVRPHSEALPRFGITVVCCFFLNLLVLKIGLEVFALPVALAQALAVGAYTVTFYLTSRILVFSR